MSTISIVPNHLNIIQHRAKRNNYLANGSIVKMCIT